MTGTRLGDPWRWFDPCAFALPTPGYLGNAGRNIIRGPGLANLDFSLTKGSRLRFLGESGQLEFRAEIFNILNRVKAVEEVVAIYCATANPIQVILAETEQGRGILGVIDGVKTLGVETEADRSERQAFLQKIGYKR